MGLHQVSAEELREEFASLFPMISFQGMRSEKYYVPTVEKLKEVLEITKVDRLSFLPDVFDCDSFSLQLHADVKRLRAVDAESGKIPRQDWVPWAFGEVFGVRFRGRQGKHSLNICKTREGVYLIEPQTDEMWIPNSSNDVVLLVWM